MTTNVVYLTLPEAFDRLEQNSYRGAITALDRESKKVILFAESGVYVTSKGPRRGMRLVDLLRREGSLPRHVLEDALADERELNWRKSLGDILVEGGHLSQKALDSRMRMIVEEEVYDLFLWRSARYTFDPSATVESVLGEQVGHASHYRTDAVKFGRAIRERIAQWNIHPAIIPHPTTVYAMDTSQFGKIKDLGLTRQMIQEAQRFGELSISELIEQTSLSKPDFCHLLYTLLRWQILFPMSLDVAMQKATEAEAQEQYHRAATFYGYLAFASELQLELFQKYLDYSQKIKKLDTAVSLVEELGWILYEQGRYSDSVSLADLVLQFSPGHLSVLTLQFHCYAQLADTAKVLQVGKSLGELLVSRKKFQEAENHFQYLLQWFPDNVDFKVALADVYIKTKKIDEGVAKLRECAQIYEKQRRTEDALRIYKLIHDVSPDNQEALKKIRSIERKRLLKKLTYVGIPLLIIAAVSFWFLQRSWEKVRLEKEANRLLTRTVQEEGSLWGQDDLDKLIAQEREKAFSKIQQKLDKLSKMYEKLEKQYSQTSVYETALKRKLAFLEKRRAILEFVKKKKEELERKKKEAAEKKAKQREAFNKAFLTKREGVRLIKDGKVEEGIKVLRKAFDLFLKFYHTYPEASDIIHSVSFKLPMVIDSIPRGAQVYFGTKEDRANYLGKTPLVFEYQVNESKLIFTFVAPGFKKLITNRKLDPQWVHPPLQWDKFHVLRPTLNMKPVAYNSLPVGPIETSFAIFRNVLFFGARDGKIYGVHFFRETETSWNSRLIWQEKNQGKLGEVFTTPVLIRSMIVVGNSEGELAGITLGRKKKFKVVWKQPTGGEEGEAGGPILDTPTVYQYPSPEFRDRYYLGVSNFKGYSYIFRFTWKKKRVIAEPFFSYKSENRLLASPIMDFNEVFIAGTDNFLVKLPLEYTQKAKTIAQAQWFFEGGDDFLVRPVPCLDLVLQGCKNQYLYAVDRVSGKEKWKVRYPSPIIVAPIIWDRYESHLRFMKAYAKFQSLDDLWKKYQNQNTEKASQMLQKLEPYYKKSKKEVESLKKRLRSRILLILAFENTVGIVNLEDLEKAAHSSQARGKVLSVTANIFPWKWKTQFPDKGHVKRTPHLIHSNTRSWLLVTTSKGYILCFDLLSKEQNRLKWQYFSPYLTSDVLLYKNRLFFADRARVQQEGKTQWEYRVNCLLVY